MEEQIVNFVTNPWEVICIGFGGLLLYLGFRKSKTGAHASFISDMITH